MHQRIISTLSIFLVLACVFVLFGIITQDEQNSTITDTKNEVTETHILTIEEATVSVEIVDTPRERSKGLSGRESLPEGTGMFFVMDNLARHGFWMPDMLFSIDIIWLDGNMEVVDITENATPESFPKVFRPERPAQYVLEVPNGFSQKNNITIGSIANVDY